MLRFLHCYTIHLMEYHACGCKGPRAHSIFPMKPTVSCLSNLLHVRQNNSSSLAFSYTKFSTIFTMSSPAHFTATQIFTWAFFINSALSLVESISSQLLCTFKLVLPDQSIHHDSNRTPVQSSGKVSSVLQSCPQQDPRANQPVCGGVGIRDHHETIFLELQHYPAFNNSIALSSSFVLRYFQRPSVSANASQAMVLDQLYVILAGVAALIAAGFVTHSKLNYGGDVPSGLPWVGLQHGFLSDLRTRIASLGGALETIEAGYRKVRGEDCSLALQFKANSSI